MIDTLEDEIVVDDPMASPAAKPQFTTQPVNGAAELNSAVTFTAAASDATSYQWQADKNNGKGWSKLTNGTTWRIATTENGTTLTFDATTARATYKFRCVATNDNGSTASNEVILIIGTLPEFTTPPEDAMAELNEMAVFTAEASNAESYEWQADKNNGKGWSKLTNGTTWQIAPTESGTGTTLSFLATAARATYKYRCVAINADGSVESEEVFLVIGSPNTKPVFTSQPQNAVAAVNEMAIFTAEASNVDSYQWQADKNNGKGWSKLTNGTTWQITESEGGTTLSFTATEARANYKFRCVATNADGSTPSDEVTLTILTLPAFTSQPQNAEAALNELAIFTAEASNVDSYEWQADKNNGKGWSKLTNGATWQIAENEGVTTLSFTATDARATYKFRCVAVNTTGSTPSDEVTLTIDNPVVAVKPAFTTQPQNAVAAVNEMAIFTAEASNADSYQWQADKNNGKGWSKLTNGATWQITESEGGTTLSFTATEARANYKFRCVATNADGSTPSDEVTLTILTLPAFTSQPQNAEAALNELAIFTAEASNVDSYEWQADKNNGKGWSKLTNGATWQITESEGGTTLSFTATVARANYKYRCVAVNTAGSTPSDEVTLTILAAPVFTTQPQNVQTAANTPVTVTAAASGDATYRWQTYLDDVTGWIDLLEGDLWQGVDTATLTCSATVANAEFDVRCVATNAGGSTASDAVVVTVLPDVPLPTFTAPPADVSAALNTPVVFTAVANDADSYEWQADKNNGKGWSKLTNGTTWQIAENEEGTTLTFTATAARATYKYRCVAINTTGSTPSDEVFLIIITAPAFTTQPEDAATEVENAVTFTVAASGDPTYQWQVYQKDDDTWVDLEETDEWQDVDTDTLTFTPAEDGVTYQVRCVATNAAGSTASDEATVTVGTPTVEDNGVVYKKLTDTTCAVVAYTGNASTLEILGKVGDWTVTEIGQSAFEGNTTLVSIDLPDSITVIRAYAFKGCTSLSEMK